MYGRGGKQSKHKQGRCYHCIDASVHTGSEKVGVRGRNCRREGGWEIGIEG